MIETEVFFENAAQNRIKNVTNRLIPNNWLPLEPALVNFPSLDYTKLSTLLPLVCL